MKKGGKHFAALVIAVLVVAIGLAGYKLWELFHPKPVPGNWPTTMGIYTDDGLVLYYPDEDPSSDGAETVSAVATGDEPVSSGAADPGVAVAYDEYSTYLPSPDDWLGGMRRHEDQATDGGWLVSFRFDLDDRQAAYDYVELLQGSRFQLTLTDTVESDHTDVAGQKFFDYFFSYNGKTPVGAIEQWTRTGTRSAPVSVAIEEDYGEGTVLLTVYYADQFSFVDDGDRCGLFPAAASGGSSGGGIDWDDDDDGRRKQCTYCDGDGTRDCLTCDGKGYIEEYVSVPNYSGSTLGSNSGWERHDCPNILCHDGQVDCAYCDGGWIY